MGQAKNKNHRTDSTFNAATEYVTAQCRHAPVMPTTSMGNPAAATALLIHDARLLANSWSTDSASGSEVVEAYSSPAKSHTTTHRHAPRANSWCSRGPQTAHNALLSTIGRVGHRDNHRTYHKVWEEAEASDAGVSDGALGQLAHTAHQQALALGDGKKQGQGLRSGSALHQRLGHNIGGWRHAKQGSKFPLVGLQGLEPHNTCKAEWGEVGGDGRGGGSSSVTLLALAQPRSTPLPPRKKSPHPRPTPRTSKLRTASGATGRHDCAAASWARLQSSTRMAHVAARSTAARARHNWADDSSRTTPSPAPAPAPPRT
jgi:hypothetical protein